MATNETAVGRAGPTTGFAPTPNSGLASGIVNFQILDLYEQPFTNDRSQHVLRWRIEHAQVPLLPISQRFAQSGVIASM
jgi:hypothetical protein